MTHLRYTSAIEDMGQDGQMAFAAFGREGVSPLRRRRRPALA
jgi:hypothetical protein